MFKTLLALQELDLRIEALKARELEIPKQKDKFKIYRERLAAELAEREQGLRQLQVEVKECEVEIEEKQAQITKYDQQLFGVKKNEEYQALLHEIEMQKKQIALKEERLLALMVDVDEGKVALAEDRKRIEEESKGIDLQCEEVDQELAEAEKEREAVEEQRKPLLADIESSLLSRYERIRMSKRGGAAVVALNDEVCGGCHMRVTPQIANEILEGKKTHACSHCGRLLYHPQNVQSEIVGESAEG